MYDEDDEHDMLNCFDVSGDFSNTHCCCVHFSMIYSFKKEYALMGREVYVIEYCSDFDSWNGVGVDL